MERARLTGVRIISAEVVGREGRGRRRAGHGSQGGGTGLRGFLRHGNQGDEAQPRTPWLGAAATATTTTMKVAPVVVNAKQEHALEMTWGTSQHVVEAEDVFAQPARPGPRVKPKLRRRL